jgi:hypothetical protein
MSMFARSTNRRRAFITGFVFAAFVWAIALSTSSPLHQRVHPDANRVEHTCGVTMIASGTYNYSAHAPLVSVPVPAVQFSKISTLSPLWVQSPFLGASVFEHGPPSHS